MRRPTNDAWLDTLGMVAVDEAQLLQNPRRGPTLEYLLTSFLARPSPPRIALLSATLGETESLHHWLTPCDLVQENSRWPPLQKKFCILDEAEDATEALQKVANEILDDESARLLLFVYQTRTADKLAKVLPSARAYHARLTPAIQNATRKAFESGECRCVITTSALAQGVNLPASHVLVFETTYPGVGPLGDGEILQMIGRAGRGDRPGTGIVFLRPSDTWTSDRLAQLLTTEEVTSTESRYEREEPEGIATRAAAYLARQPQPVPQGQVQTFFTRSLHGAAWAAQVPQGLHWLTDPGRSLAHRDEEERYRLTTLGLAATRAVIPLPVASGFAQLLRDLLQLDPEDSLLAQWKPLDFLVLLHLTHSSLPKLRPYSAGLVERVDNWMESHPSDIPVLYREWLSGPADTSRAREVLGSLGLPGGKPQEAHKSAYSALFHAIVLWERGQGKSTEDLTRAFKITEMSGVEERWRDECLWLLTGISKLLEVRCFYYHLKETCQANAMRIKRVKRALTCLRRTLWEAEGALLHCSPLGGILQQMRRLTARGNSHRIGIQSIRRLEASGIQDFTDLEALTRESALIAGLTEAQFGQLQRFLLRFRA